jgi:hypothetical protein
MPDGHQVIEHCFAQLKTVLWNAIYARQEEMTSEIAKSLVESLFKGCHKHPSSKTQQAAPCI